MSYSHFKHAILVIFIISAFLQVSCIKNLTITNTVYENSFDDYKLNTLEVSGWKNGIFGMVSEQRIGTYNGNTLLGKFNNNQVILNLYNLPSHQALRVELDLYLHNNWRNDLWKMSFDGNDKLLTGFSNDSSIKQSYPNWLGNGSSLSPAGNDAVNIYLPGTCSFINSARGTSLYRIITTVSHSSSSFVLSCSDAGGILNDTCQRSWSMDNLKVSVFKN